MHGWMHTWAVNSLVYSHGLAHWWDYRQVGLLTEFYGTTDLAKSPRWSVFKYTHAHTHTHTHTHAHTHTHTHTHTCTHMPHTHTHTHAHTHAHTHTHTRTHARTHTYTHTHTPTHGSPLLPTQEPLHLLLSEVFVVQVKKFTSLASWKPSHLKERKRADLFAWYNHKLSRKHKAGARLFLLLCPSCTSFPFYYIQSNLSLRHLTKATTWKLRTHNFNPFNLRIQMYVVPSWKCDHLRNANCGHRRSALSVDSTCEKRPHTSNCAKNTFLIV